MRNKRAKQIFKLVRDKDPNIIKHIKEYVGESHFEKMGGTAIYRMAKKLWTKGIIRKENLVCSK